MSARSPDPPARYAPTPFSCQERWTDNGPVNATTAGWVGDIQTLTLDNPNFRTVLFTAANLQLTVMCLATGEEIGVEMHDRLDQFIRVESGQARVTLGPSATEVEVAHEIADDWAIIIPGGTWHNVINTGTAELRLYSVYAPAEHPDGTVHVTKADADAAEHH
jgi:mannose-6-phosphate isomerase-like protein (cupin superfamily)